MSTDIKTIFDIIEKDQIKKIKIEDDKNKNCCKKRLVRIGIGCCLAIIFLFLILILIIKSNEGSNEGSSNNTQYDNIPTPSPIPTYEIGEQQVNVSSTSFSSTPSSSPSLSLSSSPSSSPSISISPTQTISVSVTMIPSSYIDDDDNILSLTIWELIWIIIIICVFIMIILCFYRKCRNRGIRVVPRQITYDIDN